MERRNTIQREMILKAVHELNHPCADEVYEQISMDHPNIGKATVYRNLNVLTEAGVLMKFTVPGGPDRFDCNPKRHFHAQCIRCKRILDVELKEMPAFPDWIEKNSDFQFVDYTMHFRGICSDCQEKAF